MGVLCAVCGSWWGCAALCPPQGGLGGNSALPAPALPRPPCRKLSQLRNMLVYSCSRRSFPVCLLRNLPAAPQRTNTLLTLHSTREKWPDSIKILIFLSSSQPKRKVLKLSKNLDFSFPFTAQETSAQTQ